MACLVSRLVFLVLFYLILSLFSVLCFPVLFLIHSSLCSLRSLLSNICSLPSVFSSALCFLTDFLLSSSLYSLLSDFFSLLSALCSLLVYALVGFHAASLGFIGGNSQSIITIERSMLLATTNC